MSTSSRRSLDSRQDLVARLRSRPGLSLRVYENPDLVRSRYRFRYEQLGHPSLEALRRRYRLDRVVASGRTEFERMVLLRSWVASRWKHGTPRVRWHASLKAIQILSHATRGARFFCHHDATTYIQCCLALGWQARYLGVMTSGIPGHSVTEVWSNQYRKWIAMDATFDLHYLRHGVPLNALELHDVWLTGGPAWTETRVVHGHSGPNMTNLHALRAYKLFDYYYFFGIAMGNDLSRHRGHANVWADNPFLQLDDPRLHGLRRRPFPICRFTARRQDLYWSLNETHIDLVPVRGARALRVGLRSVTPGLAGYLVRLDGGNWRARPARFAWLLHGGRNAIEVKAVNRCGVEGAVSRLSIVAR